MLKKIKELDVSNHAIYTELGKKEIEVPQLRYEHIEQISLSVGELAILQDTILIEEIQ